MTERRVVLARRTFLGLTAAGGGALALGFWLRSEPPSTSSTKPAKPSPLPGELDAWVRLGVDGRVSITVPKAEMGQGVLTTLSAIVAEEMGADFDAVVPELAGASPVYADPLLGAQSTGASTSVEAMYRPLRAIGARVRALLVAAAAAEWDVEPSACDAARGRVHHRASGRSLSFGELARAAAEVPVPTEAPLRPEADHRLLGRSLPRLDARDKVTGRARYTVDVSLPGMRVAQLERSPSFGGTVRRIDAERALAVEGVERVEILGAPIHAVAVVAESFWAAERGRRALEVEWDRGAFAYGSDATLRADLEDAAAFVRSVTPADTEEVVAALERSERRIERTYESGFFAHLAMEPMSAVAHVVDGRCEVWAGQQNVDRTVDEAAAAAGVTREQVTFHPMLIGGSFGRRYQPDAVVEAVTLARRIGAPVKVMWTRADDIRHDYYQPAARSTLEVGWTTPDRLDAWRSELRVLSARRHARVGMRAVEAYDVAASSYAYLRKTGRVSLGREAAEVPSGALRGVGAVHHAFARESLLDEIALVEGVDPLALRRRLAPVDPRAAAVLAAAQAAWDRPLPAGVGQGVAFNRYKSHSRSALHAWIAAVAEVERDETAEQPARVTRLSFFVDCGRVLDPRNVTAQIEGGALFALATFMDAEIHIASGGVAARAFGDMGLLRIDRAPVVEVELASRPDAPPVGVGELSTPVVAPAVANAYFALTGERRRRLPLFGRALV